MFFKVAGSAIVFAAIFLPTGSFALAQCDRDTLPSVPFDSTKLSEHVRVLASDEFEGRAPVSAGEQKTLAYLGAQFAALGLEPAGDRQGWTQEVPLRKFELAEPATVTVKFKGAASELKFGEEVIVASLAAESRIDIRDAPIVFVGYGVTAPEAGWDDFKGVDLAGKIAVFLVNDPDFEAPAPGKFGGKAMTYYGRWAYKYEEAARRGALAALIVHEDVPAAYGWTTVQNSWGTPRFDIVRTDPRVSHPLIEGWLRREAVIALFQQAGLDFPDLKKRAMQPSFVPVSLKDASLSVQAQVRTTQVVSHNVIAKLTARGQSNESVVYSAHWDHLGTGKPDSTGDRIYHGAVDNAMGVAGLLELARVFATQPRTARSIYFLAFTAEEGGLLGSQYYALHPSIELERTAAVLNMDLFGTDGPACDISMRGAANSELHGIVETYAKKQGRMVSPDTNPEAGYFYRSDHFPLAKLGVPAVWIVPGQDLFQGGVAAGKKAYADYIAHRYHQPADKWSPDWDLRGVKLDLGVLYETGRHIANSRVWPKWHAGSEFKLIRDRSAAKRPLVP